LDNGIFTSSEEKKKKEYEELTVSGIIWMISANTVVKDDV
jgi:hypothetical protein